MKKLSQKEKRKEKERERKMSEGRDALRKAASAMSQLAKDVNQTIDIIHERNQQYQTRRLKRDNGIDMVCCFNPEYKITFVNQTFARALGVSNNELIGSDIRSVISHEIDTLGLSPESPVKRTQVHVTTPDGKASVQDWIDHATFSEDGQPIEYQRIGRDISDLLK